MSNRPKKYNRNTDFEAITLLTELMKGERKWITSIQLSKLSGRRHNNIRRDIKRDLIDRANEMKSELGIQGKKLVHFGFERIFLDMTEKDIELINNSDLRSMGTPEANENDIPDEFIVTDDRDIYDMNKALQRLLVGEIERPDENGNITKIYVLNREAALVIMMRYSIYIKSVLSNVVLTYYNTIKK